jgi:hypothetical protein
VEEVTYLGTTLTCQNSIQGEIKSSLKSRNDLLQKVLSSSLLSKQLKFKIYKTIILPVVLYGCKTWSLILREERRPRVFGNRVLRRIGYLEDPGIDGRIILRWIFRKWDVELGTGSSWLRTDRWWAVVNAVMKLWFT